jgi:hypothetical protein
MYKTFLELWLRKEKKMLKKSLIAIAILAIAMPAFAAETNKFHKPWSSTTTYNWQCVTTMNVVMDVGYWIQIDKTGDIKVQQDALLGNAFYSYSGCKSGITVKANFAAVLKATASAKSAAGGSWSGTINDASTYTYDSGMVGTTQTIKVCVSGTNVDISKLSQSDNVKVAEVSICVIPEGLN